jgi:monofunctional glycosyltransferase
MLKRGLLLLIMMAALGISLSVLWVLLLRWVPPPTTWVMCAEAREHGELHRQWVAIGSMNCQIPLAVVAAEDQKFMDHRGFDMQAIQKAMDHNAEGRSTRGASTISQQTAKNVFLWPGRTWLRKGLEVWFTVLIEGLWGKRRIMEVYLNVAEMGKGVFGVEAAAQACFGRTARSLSRDPAALLAATLPAPKRYSCARPGPYIKRRKAWVARNMRNLGQAAAPFGYGASEHAPSNRSRKRDHKKGPL